jgi:hypothetical protein
VRPIIKAHHRDTSVPDPQSPPLGGFRRCAIGNQESAKDVRRHCAGEIRRDEPKRLLTGTCAARGVAGAAPGELSAAEQSVRRVGAGRIIWRSAIIRRRIVIGRVGDRWEWESKREEETVAVAEEVVVSVKEPAVIVEDRVLNPDIAALHYLSLTAGRERARQQQACG